MPADKAEEFIDAPPQSVWAFVSDVDRIPTWMPIVDEITRVSERPIGQETVYRERDRIGRLKGETTWRITRFESPHVQVHQCRERSLAAVVTLIVAPEHQGSRLTFHLQYKMMPVFRPLGWAVEKAFGRAISRQQRQAVRNVKQMIEAQEESRV